MISNCTGRVARLGLLFWVSVPAAAWCLEHAGSAAAQAPASTEIALDPAIECWYDSQFPALAAQVRPPGDVIHSRLYFRCSLYPDYYFVDLVEDNGVFRGVAPQADEKCPEVHYYVEALSRDFTATRTEERVADVTSASECRKRYPAAAWFPGDNPKLLLGSTVNGPLMAPGFKSLGISGFISATGATVPATQGGISSGVVAGLAAGGAAAVGLGVLAAGGANSTTTTTAQLSPPPAPTTTIASTTTVPPVSALKACFQLDPPNGVIEPNEPLRIDGRCSQGGDNLQFRYDLGDGRIKEGQAFITAVWSTPGIYTLTLTVSRASSPLRSREGPGAGAGAGAEEEQDSYSTQVTVERPVEPVVADFVATQKIDTCIVSFDASSSSGPIDRYEWALDLRNDFGPVVHLQGKKVTYDWKSACFRSNGVFVARLTVTGAPDNTDSIEKTISIIVGLTVTDGRPANGSLEGSVSTEMLDSKGARGQVLVGDGQSYPVSAGTPTLVRYPARSGRNELQAVMASETPALWRFDFSGTRGFVAGSLRTQGGQEVSRDAYSVVLRFSGRPGERVRVEYRLEP